MTGAAARNYSWPPFEPGNVIGQRHGAYSSRSWKPLADRIASELVTLAPWAARPAYGPTAAAWARTEAQVVLVMTYLDEHGPLDGDGEPRPAGALLDKLEARAQSLRAELGLSPLALARLHAAFDRPGAGGADPDALDAVRAEGRELVAARAVLDAAEDVTNRAENDDEHQALTMNVLDHAEDDDEHQDHPVAEDDDDTARAS